MSQPALDHPVAHHEGTLPGPLYPDRCLECAELLRETYGAVTYLRCSGCVSADLARTDPTGRKGLID